MLRIMLITTMSLVLSGGTYEQSLGTVDAGIVCTDVKGAIDALKTGPDELMKWLADVSPKVCITLGGAEGTGLPIMRIVSGPHTDSDGNEFYEVEVPGRLYALAWPGSNSDLKVKPGVDI